MDIPVCYENKYYHINHAMFLPYLQCFENVIGSKHSLRSRRTFSGLSEAISVHIYYAYRPYLLNASFDGCEHLEGPAGARSLGLARWRRWLLGSRWCRRWDASSRCSWRRHASPTAIRFAKYRAVPRRAASTTTDTAAHRLGLVYRDPIRHVHLNSPHHARF